MYNTNGVGDCRELPKIKSVNKDLTLKDFALKMLSMFGNTYVCESKFSTMKKSNLKTEIEW